MTNGGWPVRLAEGFRPGGLHGIGRALLARSQGGRVTICAKGLAVAVLGGVFLRATLA